MKYIDAEELTPSQAALASVVLTEFARWTASAVRGPADMAKLKAISGVVLELVMTKWLEDAANGRLETDAQKQAFLEFCTIYGELQESGYDELQESGHDE